MNVFVKLEGMGIWAFSKCLNREKAIKKAIR